MSKAEPTAGEWIANERGEIMSIGRPIGQAFYPHDGRGGDEMRANADLFAASKDLLRELEFAYAYLEKEDGGPEWKNGIERMRAAIAKAKGEM